MRRIEQLQLVYFKQISWTRLQPSQPMVKFWALLIIYQHDCSLFQNKECLARTRLASERNTRIWVTLDERWYCWEGCQESHSSPEILWQNCLPTHRSSNYCAATSDLFAVLYSGVLELSTLLCCKIKCKVLNHLTILLSLLTLHQSFIITGSYVWDGIRIGKSFSYYMFQWIKHDR